MAARRQLFDFRRGFFAQPDGDHLIAQAVARVSSASNGKRPLPAIIPYLLISRTRARRCDERQQLPRFRRPISTSAEMRSTACLVLRPDLVSSRKALCRLSMVSGSNPRRSRPDLILAKYLRLRAG